MADTVPNPPTPTWWESFKAGMSSARLPREGVVAPALKDVRHGVPVGELAEKEAVGAPDDPANVFLNTVQDLGIVSARAVQGLTNPQNIALIALMAGGNPEAALPVLANLGFSAEMAAQATQDVAKGVQEVKKGNLREAGRLFGGAGVNALLIALGAKRGPKGATYRIGEATKPTARLQGDIETPPAPPTAKDIPLPTMQEGEIVNPKPPEQRMSQSELRSAISEQAKRGNTDIVKVLKAQLREERAAKIQVQVERRKAEAEPVPPPPEIIIQPRTVHAGGKAVTVTPGDIRAYVGAVLGAKPMEVTGPDGERQNLADKESSEAQRIREVKIPKAVHDELLPGAKFRAGMTVGEAVDQKAAEQAKVGQPDPKTGRKFSSTQIDLPKEAASKVTALAKSIPDEDLSGDGRETRPHVTVKYGLHGEDASPVEEFLKDKPPITLTLGKTAYFPPSAGSEGNDVVTIEVDSPELHSANRAISSKFPVTDTHPAYKPHITLAYVKPGMGHKYAGNTALEGQTVQADEITFSSKNGKETAIKLGGAAELQPVPAAPALELKPTPPSKPVPEVGWTMQGNGFPESLAKMGMETLAKMGHEAKLVPDPANKNRFWVSYKPKPATLTAQKAIGPAPKASFGRQDPIQPWEWDEKAMHGRLKQLNDELLRLMNAGQDIPKEVEAEHGRLLARWRDIQNENAKTHQEPSTTPRTPQTIPKGGLARERAPAGDPAPAVAPPPPTPEEKARLEVVRAGAEPGRLEQGQFLFTDPKTKSTLSLPVEGVTQDAIKRKMQESRDQIDAARRVDEPLEVGDKKNFVPERQGFMFVGGSNRKFPVEYGYMELSDLIPSHDFRTFTANPEHPGQQRISYEVNPTQKARQEEMFMKPETDRVLADSVTGLEGPPVIIQDGSVAGGNGRTMWAARMYASNEPYAPIGNISRAKLLRDATVKIAQRNGAEGVENMRQPVRVRRIAAPDTMGDWKTLTSDLNVSSAAPISMGENAVSYAGRISPSTVQAIASRLDDLNPDASIREFMSSYPIDFVRWLDESGALTTDDRMAYVDPETGGLNENGKVLYETALLAKAFNNPKFLDSSPRSVIDKMASSLAPILRIASRGGEWDIRPLLMEAAQVAGDAHARGMTVKEHVDSIPLLSEIPAVGKVVGGLAEFIDRKTANVKKGLRQFAAESGLTSEGKQNSLLAPVEPHDSFNQAFTSPVEDAKPEPTRTKKGKTKQETPAEEAKRTYRNEESRRRSARYQVTKQEYQDALRQAHESRIREAKER